MTRIVNPHHGSAGAGRPRALTLMAVAAMVAGLSACGGGGGDGPVAVAPPAPAPVVPGSQVPTAATQSADAAFEFVAELARRNEDNADPIIVGDARLATGDTTEARPLP